MLRPAAPLVAAAGNSAGFDLLLIAHVACAIVGFGALAMTGLQAARLVGAGGAEVPASLRRYFAPGVNWAGRLLYGVPLFGALLLWDSSGRYRPGQDWVVVGLVLWVSAAFVAEGLLWPAERRIQHLLALAEPDRAGLRRDALTVAGLGAALGVLFVVATVLMVAKP